MGVAASSINFNMRLCACSRTWSLASPKRSIKGRRTTGEKKKKKKMKHLPSKDFVILKDSSLNTFEIYLI